MLLARMKSLRANLGRMRGAVLAEVLPALSPLPEVAGQVVAALGPQEGEVRPPGLRQALRDHHQGGDGGEGHVPALQFQLGEGPEAEAGRPVVVAQDLLPDPGEGHEADDRSGPSVGCVEHPPEVLLGRDLGVGQGGGLVGPGDPDAPRKGEAVVVQPRRGRLLHHGGVGPRLPLVQEPLDVVVQQVVPFLGVQLRELRGGEAHPLAAQPQNPEVVVRRAPRSAGHVLVPAPQVLVPQEALGPRLPRHGGGTDGRVDIGFEPAWGCSRGDLNPCQGLSLAPQATRGPDA